MVKLILAGAACLIAAGRAGAGEVFTDEDDFLQFLRIGFFNPFDDVEFGPVGMLEFGPRRGMSYTIGAQSGLFCNTGEVSTEAAAEPIEIGFGGNEAAWMFGARFWVRDANFGAVPGTITLVYSDGTEDAFACNDEGTFRGYSADGPLTDVRVYAVPDGGEGWPAMDEVWVGLPWESDCFMDCDLNGVLDLFDFLCFITEFNAGGDYGNCNGDDAFDLFDFLCYLNSWNGDC